MAGARRIVGAPSDPPDPAGPHPGPRTPAARAGMIALALDTTTDRLSVALGRPGQPVLTRALDGARQHAAALLPLIEGLLGDAGIAFAEIQRIALADGPGGFPGLRVGAALVKALARGGRDSRYGLPRR